jgi:Fe-S-cluster containining protein
MARDRTILRNRKRATLAEAGGVMGGYIRLEQVYLAQDEARAELEVATGKPICVSGCGRCCEGMTPISTRLEALYTLSHMSLLPSYTDLKARAERWMTDGPKNLRPEQLTKAPCPFLGDDKDCTIYEFRPLACRKYGVTGNADPFFTRHLHYTESDTNRMYISRDTPLGSKIRHLVNNVTTWIRERNPVMAQVGFFPALIAQELVAKDKLAEMPIQESKMGLRMAQTGGEQK